ncbi:MULTISPECIES: hypothetical protein [Nostocales]|uniref:Uncharacterized protein n=3 Tax=Nostocales TaxID=1161 RepID=A0A8S9T614_9CYAN|nr:hypothetical protein [Tolypothrix bouteillei]KAF3887417.1 hypothetical protein DA73_0400019425 [Tolypothrix bouteillei VB521301]
MLEKLLQAAVITFLLHLIAGLSPNSIIETKVEQPSTVAPVPIANALPASAR